MNYRPHVLGSVDDATPKPPAKPPSPADDEIRNRAIEDAMRSFENGRDELRRLIRSRSGHGE